MPVVIISIGLALFIWWLDGLEKKVRQEARRLQREADRFELEQDIRFQVRDVTPRMRDVTPREGYDER